MAARTSGLGEPSGELETVGRGHGASGPVPHFFPRPRVVGGVAHDATAAGSWPRPAAWRGRRYRCFHRVIKRQCDRRTVVRRDKVEAQVDAARFGALA